ncbi:APC membrane recruitment protein 1-like [Eucyclogobius newberryi]|uniref:APC membrane recruitment protein 1-like n=1 Tax=Eucyclogobius newberryi TaxID=166745 RepID=UPI003B5966DF
MAMASSITDEKESDSKEILSDHLHRCPSDDITEELQANESNAVKAQKSGKFRRTALTFFGVRKTICILPSFFVGRSKNLSKWSSKKSIFKSKTHDGLSKVCQDDSHRSDTASAGDFVYGSHRDVAENLHSCCHNKLSPSSADQKPLSLTQHKRGLRGLFQSIKQHRNNRNATDKEEMFALSSTHETQVPVVQDNPGQHLMECLGSEPDVPDIDNIIGPECTKAKDLDERVLMKDCSKSELCHELSDHQIEMDLVALDSSDYEELSRVQSDPCLKLEMLTEPTLKSEATSGSCEQLNAMFEDVASLKSFDSLTGCGDIIADQEDDSITDSTVSGERRNGGKRASCYLTYQGGGEDMACPEEFGEACADNMWVNDTSEEMHCTCNQDLTDLSTELTGSIDDMDLNSNSGQKGADSSTADVLTPQSEHHESVPNSDEGYYDSTTPGPEEGHERADRLRPDRLPRDSYSGDALYELFAPDESLVSPHYEKKSQLSGSDKCEYLNPPVGFTDTAFLPDAHDLKLGDEVYEANSFLERSNRKPPELAQDPNGLHEMGLNKQTDLNAKTQAFVNKNMKTIASAGKSPDAEYGKRHSSISFGSTSDQDFETFCEPKEQLLEENKPVALPYRNVKTQCTEVSNDVDNEQTVCFSQALEDFTKHTQMMHNRMDGLESSSAFIPNMESLPAIVTFDVVDMHNEGEYDEQMQMDMEEELSSPYQEFEESYLQKDVFAECDYQMLDLYEQNLLSNTWAIASLPRHLGLTKVRQFLPAPLSQDRRSRSLDTEDLDLSMQDKCKDHRALPSCFLTEKDSGSSSYKKSLHVSMKDGSITSSWQTKSVMALRFCTSALPISASESLNQTQLDTKTSVTSNTDTKSLRLCSSTSDSASSELFSSSELYNTHLPLKTDCLPHNPLFYTDMMEGGPLLLDHEEHLFKKAAVNTPSYNPSMKAKPASKEGISQRSISSTGSIDQTKFD